LHSSEKDNDAIPKEDAKLPQRAAILPHSGWFSEKETPLLKSF